MGVVEPEVNVEVAVVDREPVGFLVDAAGVELAVEDPEAVEVAEVVVDNQDLPTFVETLREPGAMICLTDPVVGA